jgi:hypothetical protein
MRPRRVDEPGAWWLITNHGFAKRPVFETEQDVERFLGFQGEAVARGEIGVHAFTIMCRPRRFRCDGSHLASRIRLGEGFDRLLSLPVRCCLKPARLAHMARYLVRPPVDDSFLRRSVSFIRLCMRLISIS